MFCFQNLLLGMCLFEHSTNHVADSFRHVLGSMRHQVVVLYDLTSFKGGRKSKKKSQSCGVVSIVLGYILYVLPICGLVILSMFGHTTSMVCRPLNATFLLDNDVVPVFNMSKLYRLRQVLEQEIIESDFSSQVTPIDNSAGGLMWNYDHTQFGYRRNNYWPIDNITDLIKQYNYIGFHDICIYPTLAGLIDYTLVTWPWQLSTKGLRAVYHGYAVRNNTGADLDFYLLISYEIILISI